MDYTLTIEFGRLSVDELKYTLQILFHASSECYVDIELLADEVIRRLNDYRYSIREKYNKNFKLYSFDTSSFKNENPSCSNSENSNGTLQTKRFPKQNENMFY